MERDISGNRGLKSPGILHYIFNRSAAEYGLQNFLWLRDAQSELTFITASSMCFFTSKGIVCRLHVIR